MMRYTQRRLLRILAATLLGSASVLAVWCFPSLQPNTHLAWQWMAEIEEVPDDQVTARLRRMTLLGDAGLAVLVQCLGRDRRSVAGASASILNAELDRWKSLDARRATANVVTLARLLAEHRGDRVPQPARDLATRILLWPIDRKLADPVQVTWDCELVLRTPAVSRPETDPSASERKSEIVEERTGKGPVDSDRGLVATLAADGPASLSGSELMLPGGALPMRIAGLFPRARTDQGDWNASVSSRPSAAIPKPGLFIPPPAGGLEGGAEVSSRWGTAPRRLTIPTMEVSVAPDPELARVHDLTVIQRLAADDAVASRSAEAELRRRGFRSPQLALARKLVDPNVNARLELVSVLPGMPGVDPRRWLFWLCQDNDPNVRKAAVTVIATMNDPSLRTGLAALEATETDVDVLERLREVLDPRRNP